MENGTFIISLDFELLWGVFDTRNKSSYGNNILGARKAIAELLDLFETYNIKVTIAAVGFLFCKDKAELVKALPGEFPSYVIKKLSPYNGHFDHVGNNEEEDPYHFGLSLIKMILKKRKHEIATHTFSHYYCLEKGQTPKQFQEDLKAAKKIASSLGIGLKSIVFPRNQYDTEYLEVCRKEGIIGFRGNEDSWIYKARGRDRESLLRRSFRLVDCYINITGYHLQTPSIMNGVCSIPSSRFLRPFNKKLFFLEGLRLRRIKKQMSEAAMNKKIFHLWWHPHNFGNNLQENIGFLKKILSHYQSLHDTTGFTSKTMNETSSEFLYQTKNESR